MDAAPKMVQDAVTNPVTQQVLSEISGRYALHIDVSGLLEKLTSYTLIGYIGPQDFFRELQASGVSEKEAREIMDEINKKIFMPLRDAERKEAPEAMTPAPAPKPVSAPRPAVPSTPSSLPPRAVLPTRPVINLLEDHEEPSIHFPPLPSVIPQVAAPAPVSALAQASIPRSEAIVQPQNLPGSFPPVPVPETATSHEPVAPAPAPAPAPLTPAKPVVAQPVVPSVPPITSYSVDPYREPIDEKNG